MISNEDDYSIYRWWEIIEEERCKIKCKDIWLDNRSIISYYPYLFKYYNTHINIEIYSNINIFKYLFKYVYKNNDWIIVILQNNEIHDYINIYYISTSETIWHIFGFKLHHWFSTIQYLQIHLLNKQIIIFDNDINIIIFL